MTKKVLLSTPILAIFSLFFSTVAFANPNGYAVVHPDGHVCGVIVANTPDPFGNGGKMPDPYMGCPSGSSIVMQTTPSETGNVAGWHGNNVTYSEPANTFTITNKYTYVDEKTKEEKEVVSVSTIKDGVVTHDDGKSYDTGTGALISIPENLYYIDLEQISPTTTETFTVTSEPVTAEASLVVFSVDAPAPVEQEQKVAEKKPTKKTKKSLPKSKRSKKS